jgi:hypothetical protein
MGHWAQSPAWQVSHAGQSQSDTHALPHWPVLLPGSRLQTSGA